MKTISCDLCEGLLSVIEDFRVGDDICTDCLAKIYAVAPHALSPHELVWLHTKGLHAIEPEIFDRLVQAMDTYLLRWQLAEALKQALSETMHKEGMHRAIVVITELLHPDYRMEFFREVTSNENL